MRVIVVGCILLALVACGVRQQDTDAWIGQPVSALELHPIFVTMPVVKTRTSDGTEIWNYSNSVNMLSCGRFGTGAGSGTVNTAGGSGTISGYVNYSSFTSCVANSGGCNNLFYVKNGIVQRYAPVGSGGVMCYTDSRLQPRFSGPANYR